MAKTKVWVGCVIESPEKPGHYLLVDETEEHKRGKKSLPGGGRDEGESLPKAAMREVLEESGLVVELAGVVGEYDDLNRRTLLRVYAGNVVGGELTPTEEHPIVEFYSLKSIIEFAEQDILRSPYMLDAIQAHARGYINPAGFMHTIQPSTPTLALAPPLAA